MIFAYTWQKVLSGEKTETRRLVLEGDKVAQCFRDKYGSYDWGVLRNGRFAWVAGNTYAVQPGRGKRQVARIRVLNVHRERLQAISEEDARKEGFASRDEFAHKWDEIHRKKGTRWEDNPLVWVITFELVR